MSSWASQKASFNDFFEQPVHIAFQIDEKLIFVPVNWFTDQDIYKKEHYQNQQAKKLSGQALIT